MQQQWQWPSWRSSVAAPCGTFNATAMTSRAEGQTSLRHDRRREASHAEALLRAADASRRCSVVAVAAQAGGHERRQVWVNPSTRCSGKILAFATVDDTATVLSTRWSSSTRPLAGGSAAATPVVAI